MSKNWTLNPESILRVLLGRVDASNPEKCWPYLGYTGKPAYRLETAKFLFWWFRGWVSFDLHLLHQCQCKACVNPWHLYYGTAKQNAKDRKHDGNQNDMSAVALARWQGGHPVLMDKAAVAEIREKASKGITHYALADEYRVSRPHISAIVAKKSWRNV